MQHLLKIPSPIHCCSLYCTHREIHSPVQCWPDVPVRWCDRAYRHKYDTKSWRQHPNHTRQNFVEAILVREVKKFKRMRNFWQRQPIENPEVPSKQSGELKWMDGWMGLAAFYTSFVGCLRCDPGRLHTARIRCALPPKFSASCGKLGGRSSSCWWGN